MGRAWDAVRGSELGGPDPSGSVHRRPCITIDSSSSCHPSPGRKQRMASLVLKMSVSLDGFVAPIDGSTDWVAVGRSDDGARWTVETLSNAGAHLMGATTYAEWAAYWPRASGPFAKPMNEIPKVVFSNSLASADWAETTLALGGPGSPDRWSRPA